MLPLRTKNPKHSQAISSGREWEHAKRCQTWRRERALTSLPESESEAAELDDSSERAIRLWAWSICRKTKSGLPYPILFSYKNTNGSDKSGINSYTYWKSHSDAKEASEHKRHLQHGVSWKERIPET